MNNPIKDGIYIAIVVVVAFFLIKVFMQIGIFLSVILIVVYLYYRYGKTKSDFD